MVVKKKKSVRNDASMGVSLDMSMDSMEETRFKKKYQHLIHKLSKKLHFTTIELECLLIIYYKLQKEGEIKQPGVTKTQFRDVLHCGFDMTDDNLMDRIFLAIDKGPSSYVSMETWATTLSLFLRGSLEEKIEFCFSVYDIMGEGILGRDTIFYLLRNSLVSSTGDEDAEESIKDMIEVITKKMDLDRDGKISFNDYRQSVLKQPMLLEAFGQCLPSRNAIHAFMISFTTNPGKL
ncbi:calaxin [Leptinotarsa decemlineata]|uniref:calaxin n=1 Tax=Leptinotarsa decemlineata TaxID=7539 RepID=UPI003D30511B